MPPAAARYMPASSPLLILGLPPDSLISLNVGPTTGTSGPNFQGFGAVPHGIHLLRLGDSQGMFFHHQSLSVFKFVRDELIPEPADLMPNFAAGLARGNFPNLVPYRDDTWPQLSSHLTPALLSRLRVPLTGWLDVGAVSFSALRRKDLLRAAPPASRHVTTLQGTLDVYFHSSLPLLLANLELAYICFVGLSSYEGLQAWLGTLRLVAEPSDAVSIVLNAQLLVFPEAMLDLETGALVADLARIASGPLVGTCLRLFGSEFSPQDESEEEAPLVVVEPKKRPSVRVEVLSEEDDEQVQRMPWMIDTLL